MLNFGWTWRGKMLAHPVDQRQACAGQAVQCLFYTILGSMDTRKRKKKKKKLAFHKSMCEMPEFSQHTPGFHVLCLLWKQRYE